MGTGIERRRIDVPGLLYPQGSEQVHRDAPIGCDVDMNVGAFADDDVSVCCRRQQHERAQREQTLSSHSQR